YHTHTVRRIVLRLLDDVDDFARPRCHNFLSVCMIGQKLIGISGKCPAIHLFDEIIGISLMLVGVVVVQEAVRAAPEDEPFPCERQAVAVYRRFPVGIEFLVNIKLDAHDLSFIIEGGDEHTTAFLRHPLITLNARFQLIDPLQGERTGAIVELRCGGSKLILSHAQTAIFDRLVIYALELALREMISYLFPKYAIFHRSIISICRFITYIIPNTGMPVTTCLLYLLHDFLCLLPDRYQIIEPVGAVIQQNDIIFRYTECLRHL